MRWNLVARTGEFVRRGVLQLLAQGANVLLQSVYLLLLAKYCAVERIEKVFRKTHLGLKFVQFSFHHPFPGKGKMVYIFAFDFLPGAAGGT